MKKASVSSISNNPVAVALQEMLVSTYTTYLLTHNYHWNVEGPNFYSLHKLLDDQYNELFAAIDEIAERIRALDAYALVGGLADLAAQAKKYPSPVKSGKDASRVAETMIGQLISSNEDTVAAAQKAKRAAEKAGDDESVDIMVGRITAHQKAIWMLKSSVK